MTDSEFAALVEAFADHLRTLDPGALVIVVERRREHDALRVHAIGAPREVVLDTIRAMGETPGEIVKVARPPKAS